MAESNRKAGTAITRKRFIATPGVDHSRCLTSANPVVLWERLFRTYTQPADLRSLRYGLDGLDDRQRQKFKGLNMEPFRSPEQRSRRIRNQTSKNQTCIAVAFFTGSNQ